MEKGFDVIEENDILAMNEEEGENYDHTVDFDEME